MNSRFNTRIHELIHRVAAVTRYGRANLNPNAAFIIALHHSSCQIHAQATMPIAAKNARVAQRRFRKRSRRCHLRSGLKVQLVNSLWFFKIGRSARRSQTWLRFGWVSGKGSSDVRGVREGFTGRTSHVSEKLHLSLISLTVQSRTVCSQP